MFGVSAEDEEDEYQDDDKGLLGDCLLLMALIDIASTLPPDKPQAMDEPFRPDARALAVRHFWKTWRPSSEENRAAGRGTSKPHPRA